QASLTIDPNVIASGFANDGQDQPTEGQVASLASTNNFINICLTVPNLPVTNGKQITTGSCNPSPIGVLPSFSKMPSTKFVFPPNGGSLSAGDPFTIALAVRNPGQALQFTNIQESFLAAPQQLDGQGFVQGYYAVVIDQLVDLFQTTPTDPKNFVFWRAIFNQAVNNGMVTVDVTTGLPSGTYRITSMVYAMNHQPVFSPIEQHGFFGDAAYVSSS
ncbi:hypothetical protein K435DRAFT_619218, partial [Dendrothele bispora CBS 962.96]